MAKKNNNLNLNSLTSQIKTDLVLENKKNDTNIVETLKDVEKINIEDKINVITLSSRNVKTLQLEKKEIKEYKHRKTIYIEDKNLKILKLLEFKNGKDMSFYVNQIIDDWSKENSKL